MLVGSHFSIYKTNQPSLYEISCFVIKHFRFLKHHKVAAFRNHDEFATLDFIGTGFGNINCLAGI